MSIFGDAGSAIAGRLRFGRQGRIPTQIKERTTRGSTQPQGRDVVRQIV